MDTKIYTEPEKLLQALIRFDTSNPPGYEKDCIEYIRELLESAGIETRIYALDESRPNLWAEIKSENPLKPPLLLYGHIDVVPAESESWKHQPFSGVIDGGYVHGRGAVDMKSAIAIFISVMMKVKLDQLKLDYDLILLVLSDEEDTGKYGAKFMVENHADLFKGFGCALGEMGGYSICMGGKRFYPVLVAEKQCAALRLSFRGKSGHGSARHRSTAMEKMAKAVAALNGNRLKTRITPEVSFMLKEIAKGLGGYLGFLLKLLVYPVLTNSILSIMEERGLLFDNLLHNSINVTIVGGGTAVNVVPAYVYADADVRLLPGCPLETALDDIRELLLKKTGLSNTDYEIEVLFYDRNDFKPELKYFDLLRQTLLEADPGGIPVPFVFGAVTDSRILSKAGVMTYGFIPMRLPENFDFSAQLHAANEHLPVDALTFGIDTLLLFLEKYMKF